MENVKKITELIIYHSHKLLDLFSFIWNVSNKSYSSSEIKEWLWWSSQKSHNWIILEEYILRKDHEIFIIPEGAHKKYYFKSKIFKWT